MHLAPVNIDSISKSSMVKLFWIEIVGFHSWTRKNVSKSLQTLENFNAYHVFLPGKNPLRLFREEKMQHGWKQKQGFLVFFLLPQYFEDN